MNELVSYFAGKKYKNADEVLEHARKISQELKTSRQEPKLLPLNILKQHVEKILANPAALPYHAPLYALHHFGHSFSRIGAFFGAHNSVLAYHYGNAYKLVHGRERTKRESGKLHNKSGQFRTFHNFLAHVGDVSETISQLPKQPQKQTKLARNKFIGPRNLPVFQRQVLELAPKFETRRGYSAVQILQSLFGKPKSEIDGFTWERQMTKVQYAIADLSQRGILPRKEMPHPPILRSATSEDIQKHIKLVHYLLKRGHRFLRRDWQFHLDYEEAVAIGNTGLKKAIERFNPDLGNTFASYAVGWIAGQISMEVKKRARQKTREKSVSLDAQLGDGGTERYEVVAAPVQSHESEENTRQLIQTAFILHQQKLISKPDLTIFALRLAGHTLTEIGDHYSLSRERIRQREKRARDAIKQHVSIL